MKTALITGWKGFIGQNLFKKLTEKGWSAKLLEAEEARNFSHDKKALNNLVDSVDVVFHLGADSNTEEKRVGRVCRLNYDFTKKLIDSCKNKTKIVFASSASVLGNSGYPDSVYAFSKLACEDYGISNYPNGFVALRYFNVYGPREEMKGRMSSMAYHAWLHRTKGEATHLFKVDVRRDFIYVDDVVDATIKASEQDGGIFDVGTGESRTFQDLVTCMGGKYHEDETLEIPSHYQFFTQANPENFLPDWSPKHTLESGCKKYLSYLKEK